MRTKFARVDLREVLSKPRAPVIDPCELQRLDHLCEIGSAAGHPVLTAGHLLSQSSPVEAAIQGNLGEQTRKVLATLTPREEQILRMRFGIGQKADCTLEEVGKQFAVTRERIRQIEAKALRKLRQTGRSRNLEGFMERE